VRAAFAVVTTNQPTLGPRCGLCVILKEGLCHSSKGIYSTRGDQTWPKRLKLNLSSVQNEQSDIFYAGCNRTWYTVSLVSSAGYYWIRVCYYIYVRGVYDWFKGCTKPATTELLLSMCSRTVRRILWLLRTTTWTSTSSSSSSSAHYNPLLDIGVSNLSPSRSIFGYSHPAPASRTAQIVTPPGLRTSYTTFTKQVHSLRQYSGRAWVCSSFELVSNVQTYNTYKIFVYYNAPYLIVFVFLLF
jgi:hypothetical protein